MPPIIEIISVFICILFSAFFSSVETALTSITPARARQLTDEKGGNLRLFLYWVQHPGQIISTILIGNTLVNITASVLMTEVTKYFFGSNIVAISVGVMTFVILVFGEVIPKTMARYNSEAVAKPLLPALVGIHYLLMPISWLLSRLTFVIFRVMRIPLKQSPFVTQRELDYLIKLADQEGTLSKDRGRYFSSLVEFSTTQIREIMIPRDRISAIDVETDFQRLCDYVTQDNHSRYPVFSESLDQIEGFLHVKELLKYLSQGDPQAFRLSRCLRRPYFVNEGQLISQVLNEMKRHRVHLAIVRNDLHTVVGLVTLEDILEEIIGEIEDEHDEAEAGRTTPEQRMILDGTTLIRDVNTKCGVVVPFSKEYTTLSGFIVRRLKAAGRPVVPKAAVMVDSYALTVASVVGGVPDKVEITRVK